MARIGEAVEFSWKDAWCCGVVGKPRTCIWGNWLLVVEQLPLCGFLVLLALR